MSRERLPNRRASTRYTIRHGGTDFIVTVSRFGDGRLAEIFLDCAKPDSALAMHANDSAVLASLLLQQGVAVEVIQRSVAGPLETALAAAESGQ